MYDSRSTMSFSLCYKLSSFNLEVDRLKMISFLKEKAYMLFYPIKSKISLIYKNKDLTPYEDHQIGDFFKKRTHATIKISEKVGKTQSNRKYEMDNNNNNNSIGYSFSNSRIEENYILPDISQSHIQASDNTPIKNHSHKITPRVNQKQGNQILTCFNCTNGIISYYCRDCNCFLCKSCRSQQSSEHYDHKCIHIFSEDIRKSAQVYLQIIKTDLLLQKQAYLQHTENMVKSKIIDQSSRKEILLRKLEQIEQTAQKMREELPKVNSKLINPKEFEIAFQKSNSMLESIKFEKGDIDVLNQFTILNSKEKEVNDLIKDASAAILHSNFEKKINGMYSVIERAIDAVLISQQKFIKTDNPNPQPNENQIQMLPNPSLESIISHQEDEEKVDEIKSNSLLNKSSEKGKLNVMSQVKQFK